MSDWFLLWNIFFIEVGICTGLYSCISCASSRGPALTLALLCIPHWEWRIQKETRFCGTPCIFHMFFIPFEYTGIPHKSSPVVSIGHWHYLLLPSVALWTSRMQHWDGSYISHPKQLVCIVDKTRLLSYSQKKNKLMRSDTRTTLPPMTLDVSSVFLIFSFSCPRNDTW